MQDQFAAAECLPDRLAEIGALLVLRAEVLRCAARDPRQLRFSSPRLGAAAAFSGAIHC